MTTSLHIMIKIHYLNNKHKLIKLFKKNKKNLRKFLMKDIIKFMKVQIIIEIKFRKKSNNSKNKKNLKFNKFSNIILCKYQQRSKLKNLITQKLENTFKNFSTQKMLINIIKILIQRMNNM